MATFGPPPTYAEVVIVDDRTNQAKFNPIWLKWFVDLVGIINQAGGTTVNHNDLSGIQGGAASERYHITSAQATSVAALGTISSQAANNVNIDGGAIDGTTIGGVTPAAGTFTNLLATVLFRPPNADGTAQTAVALYAGDGAPNNADGANGDFFFRGNGTVAGSTVLYHKEAGAWVALTTT